ncbi:hypothetical protein OF829_15990 [Sphingomonas sp. LB-2]|uniref:hypothetical protein n=1 Tax=Sphingomonas caeni TaxID=2984949 RepID=UPI002230F228|nr:hypothetical protein [Sphingomonas caeni]MCW3848738.1 hypothetical protein [Sphingomonas caeni]
MTEETAAVAEATPEKPGYKRFRRPFSAVRLDPAAAARQGKAASLAYERFKDFAAVKLFLNTHDDTLGGRPIDLAVASAEGLSSVEAFLAR